MELAIWRDISIIWLSLFCFIGLAIPLVALFFVVRAMNALHDRSLHLLRQAQAMSRRVPVQTEQIADKVAEPVIKLQQQTKRVEVFLHSLLK